MVVSRLHRKAMVPLQAPRGRQTQCLEDVYHQRTVLQPTLAPTPVLPINTVLLKAGDSPPTNMVPLRAELSSHQVNMVPRKAGLSRHQANMVPHKAGLSSRQANMVPHKAGLSNHQANMDLRRAGLSNRNLEGNPPTNIYLLNPALCHLTNTLLLSPGLKSPLTNMVRLNQELNSLQTNMDLLATNLDLSLPQTNMVLLNLDRIPSDSHLIPLAREDLHRTSICLLIRMGLVLGNRQLNMEPLELELLRRNMERLTVLSSITRAAISEMLKAGSTFLPMPTEAEEDMVMMMAAMGSQQTTVSSTW